MRNDKHDGLTEFRRGLELLEACEYERARSEFTTSLKRAPAEQRGLVHSMRAQAAALLLDWEAVIEDATMAIRLNPVLNLALALRGRAHSALGRYSDALVDFTKLLEINPADAFAYLSRGRVHLLLGHHLVAIAEFNKAQRLEPTLERLHLYRSEAYFALGQWSAAIKAATEAIRLDDCPAVAYYVRATCRQEQSEHLQAIEDLTKVIELWPVAAAYWARAASYRELGDDERAAADERAVAELDADALTTDNAGLDAADAALPDTIPETQPSSVNSVAGSRRVRVFRDSDKPQYEHTIVDRRSNIRVLLDPGEPHYEDILEFPPPPKAPANSP